MSKVILASNIHIGCIIDDDVKAVVALIKPNEDLGDKLMELNPTKSFGFFITENVSLAKMLLEEGLQRQKLNNSSPLNIPDEYLYKF